MTARDGSFITLLEKQKRSVAKIVTASNTNIINVVNSSCVFRVHSLPIQVFIDAVRAKRL